jgi:hypothetical protein
MTPDQQQALDIQNKGRANKGIKPLQWDGDLHNKAQDGMLCLSLSPHGGWLPCLSFCGD